MIKVLDVLHRTVVGLGHEVDGHSLAAEATTTADPAKETPISTPKEPGAEQK